MVTDAASSWSVNASFRVTVVVARRGGLSVAACVGTAPPVCVRVPRRSAQVSVSRVLSSRCGMSAAQTHERVSRVGRRGGL